MPRFDLSDYETVAERIAKFWADHPKGRITTDLIHADGGQFIVKAFLFREGEDTAFATGYAEELVGSSPVNKTSAAENAETSAIGRALANANYATKGQRPSREEMAKVNRYEDDPPGSEAHVERHSRSVSSGALEDGGGTRLATEKQRALVRGKLGDKGWKVRGPDLAQYPPEWRSAGLPAITEGFPFSRVNEALALIEGLS